MTYIELVDSSNAVLTPHLNNPEYASGYRTRQSTGVEYMPLSEQEIECRKRWKSYQVERLKTMSSNAVLGLSCE